MPAVITTEYELKDNRVAKVTWSADGNVCEAILNEDNETFTYSSELDGDEKPMITPWNMTLADCVIHANMALGLIPPQKMEPIPSTNQH
jgi:hypothetical protein